MIPLRVKSAGFSEVGIRHNDTQRPLINLKKAMDYTRCCTVVNF